MGAYWGPPDERERTHIDLVDPVEGGREKKQVGTFASRLEEKVRTKGNHWGGSERKPEFHTKKDTHYRYTKHTVSQKPGSLL